jgi:hypothetical protein
MIDERRHVKNGHLSKKHNIGFVPIGLIIYQLLFWLPLYVLQKNNPTLRY